MPWKKIQMNIDCVLDRFIIKFDIKILSRYYYPNRLSWYYTEFENKLYEPFEEIFNIVCIYKLNDQKTIRTSTNLIILNNLSSIVWKFKGIEISYIGELISLNET